MVFDYKMILAIAGSLALILVILLRDTVEVDWKSRKFKIIPSLKRKRVPDIVAAILNASALYRTETDRVINTILRDKMIYVEQNISDILCICMKEYRKQLPAKSEHRTSEYSYTKYMLKSCFNSDLKDEIRRAFKENGFNKYDPTELNTYIKKTAAYYKNLIYEYIDLFYPSNFALAKEPFIRAIQANVPITAFTHEIITHAIEVQQRANKSLAAIDDKYTITINKLKV